MPCYHPLAAWYAKHRNEGTGKRSITFRLSEGYADRPLSVPCGTCLGCRLERAREWAVRCMHEASMFEENSFVTLTYDDAHLPPGGSLRPRDFVLFMKRLRHVRPGVRFFQCGEYGDRGGRPHHHAVLFGCGWPDQEPYTVRKGVQLYTSAELAQLWPHGFSSVGAVTFESAGYVARYTLKKIGREASAEKGRTAEYLTMSRRPGIGRAWIERFFKDVYPSDELVVNGRVTKPPRYYDDQVMRLAPSSLKWVKLQRTMAAECDPDGSGRRLIEREVVKEGATRALVRDLE